MDMLSMDEEESKPNSPRKMSPTRTDTRTAVSTSKNPVGAAPYSARENSKMTSRRFAMDEEELRRRQFDTYRAEARTRATSGKYDQAIEMYKKAIDLQPQHTDCLIARATCNLQVCDFDNAIWDADRAIQVNPKLAKANFIKAEALYQKGEFEMALVCYHRAKKLRPGASEYDRGIKKAEGAIEISIGDAMTSKLVKKGDLTHFEKEKSLEDRSVELLVRQSSAARRVAISRDTRDRRKRSGAGRDAKTVKQLLEELYGDWKYLEDILNDEDHMLKEIDEEALNEENKRRRLIKERREALKGNNPYQQVEEDDDKLVPPDSFGEEVRKKKQEFCAGIKDVAQKELSYLTERAEFWMQQKSPNVPGSKKGAGEGRAHARTAEILRALEDLEDAQTAGQHQASLKKALKLLESVEKTSDKDIKNKEDIVGTLNSLIGNAYLELQKYDKAITHHQRCLILSRKTGSKEAKSRALDNLGRTYSKNRDFANAIKIFEQKVPLLNTALESTWLYHELGRCYLDTGSYTEAKACAEKACNFATNTDDRAWQLNAGVLLAQAEVELHDFTSALDAFERALDIAKVDDDEDAVRAVSKAIDDVNKKIVKLEKEKQKKEKKEARRKEQEGERKTFSVDDKGQENTKEENTERKEATLEEQEGKKDKEDVDHKGPEDTKEANKDTASSQDEDKPDNTQEQTEESQDKQETKSQENEQTQNKE